MKRKAYMSRPGRGKDYTTRGASLYILRPGDVPDGGDVAACYNRGIAVSK